MRRERKLVTVVFVDLVGFTARAETLDPEDVEAILRPYHERLRAELERHGGTVEKFIGDAVMAVFGAPQVHEDDAERAVRAALAIRDWAAEEDELEVRIAVNTGEALVSLDARPEAGEGMIAGDVVNTAARMQSAAPVNGVLAGEQTYRTTSRVIDYEEAEPVAAKGKAAPVPVWEAIQARVAVGVDVRHLPRAELVGRTDELQALREALGRARRERTLQAVTLVGVPGLGKSRLVYELFRTVEEDSELVFWRQGRCLPYGEGVTFWALAEVVKSHAGILETDSAGDADRKLREAVGDLIGEGGDAEWVLTHVRPLAGVSDSGDGGEDRQAETFFAWRRFLEAIAAQRALVLVFEDLHWADERFLDFVEHLLEWPAEVPMFILCTSRPELLMRRPGWATTLSLSPLTDEETASLVHALLERAVLPADIQATLLERAAGNPLYAEEFARMVGERGLGGELPVPETVQGVIAARLDGLSVEDKELLHDAAIVGKVFWTGAVAEIAGTDRWSLEERLQRLAKRDFLRRERRSSVEGESEFAFLHVLVRDVAYASIPRAGRARKHRLAAEWFESISEDRAGDRAELLAHHYGEALELARASGAVEEAATLEAPARRYLILAGDRALQLDIAKAAAYYRQALEAFPADDLETARLAVMIAETQQAESSLHDAVASYDEALPILRAHGDLQAAGAAMAGLAAALWRIGDTARSLSVLEEAAELLEREPVSPDLVHVYTRTAINHVLAGRTREGLTWTEKALPLAEKFGLRGDVVRLLQMRGIARMQVGDTRGLDDLRTALELALESGLSFEIGSSYNNYAENLRLVEGPTAALGLFEEAIAFAIARGLTHHAWWVRSALATTLLDLGKWDESLSLADEVIAWDRGVGGSQIEVGATQTKALILALRGELEAAGSAFDSILPRARNIGDIQSLAPGLEIGAVVAERRGDPAEALSLLEELEEATEQSPAWRLIVLPSAVRVASAIGAVDLAARMADGVRSNVVTAYDSCALATADAAVAEARGELEPAVRAYEEAVERWRDFGGVVEEACALLGLGRCLSRLGRVEEAIPPLRKARQHFLDLRAPPLVDDADALLARATAAAS